MIEVLKRRFGLLGRNISYSFSKGYFTEKFNNEVFAGSSYENFDISEINHFTGLIKNKSTILDSSKLRFATVFCFIGSHFN